MLDFSKEREREREREMLTLFICLPTGHAIGRQAIVVDEVIRPLSRLFDDEDDVVRRNAHHAIQMISESNIGLSLRILLCMSVFR